MDDLEFRAEVQRTIELYEVTIGHAASRTRQMIERYGAVQALSRLMISADLQQGFKVLRNNGQLEMSFEALVVRHQDLFDPESVAAAEWRLANPNELF